MIGKGKLILREDTEVENHYAAMSCLREREVEEYALVHRFNLAIARRGLDFDTLVSEQRRPCISWASGVDAGYRPSKLPAQVTKRFWISATGRRS